MARPRRTLIPRLVIDEVGLLDEGFTNTGEDVDYCNRIRKLGFKIIQNYVFSNEDSKYPT